MEIVRICFVVGGTFSLEVRDQSFAVPHDFGMGSVEHGRRKWVLRLRDPFNGFNSHIDHLI